MQFLMGLHESYSAELSQIRLIDPLPDAQKAYAMIMRVEKERSIHVELNDISNHVACHLNLKDNRKDQNEKFANKQKPFVDERIDLRLLSQIWTFEDSCFKLHGTPDCHKVLNEQKKKGVGGRNFIRNIDEQAGGTNGGQSNVIDMVSQI
ncbi:UNVERIFIED_CONTAM: hypothetical protein Slati_2965700 [Sesamum latifolium]|uniref:Uncharacterized protein n=1 Tax=Sesamum latifolium TaxID=2727402 RepID=A0AAW2VE82_9LAMI